MGRELGTSDVASARIWLMPAKLVARPHRHVHDCPISRGEIEGLFWMLGVHSHLETQNAEVRPVKVLVLCSLLASPSLGGM